VSEQPFQFPFAGEFQVQNATAAAAIARDIGVDWDTIREAFRTFKGVKRRMEYWGQLYGADVYDDFAHHPTAIRVTLDAVKQKFPDRRLVALFEPRTNTTVRNFFQNELADALASADVVMFTPLHRMDKIPPEQRLSLEKLAADLQRHQTASLILQRHDEILPTLAKTLQKGDILLLLTNGSLGGQYQKLRELVK
jgi:UDP-N-acetylmuramate: L-alanyl-gamma-D-glutamyl-meso-diaminopimelate ligase